MEKVVEIKFNGKKYTLPVIKGTEDEMAVDISKLRSDLNLITLDRGYKNTGSTLSSITFLDGEKGILRYRGYSIEELASKASFLEVAYLLIFGELPTQEELDQFHHDIIEESIVNDDVKKIVDAFPGAAHPMGVLSSLTSALTAFNPDDVSLDYQRSKEEMYHTIVKLMGKILQNINFNLNGKLAWFIIDQDIIKSSNSNIEHLGGFTDTIRSIKGVEVAIMLHEYSKYKTRINFRSKGNVKIHKLAQRFGGGGHPFASGAMINQSIKIVREAVVSATVSEINKQIYGKDVI